MINPGEKLKKELHCDRAYPSETKGSGQGKEQKPKHDLAEIQLVIKVII